MSMGCQWDGNGLWHWHGIENGNARAPAVPLYCSCIAAAVVQKFLTGGRERLEDAVKNGVFDTPPSSKQMVSGNERRGERQG